MASNICSSSSRCAAKASTNILLVDDEQEFVQTLAERLNSRNFQTSVALNGEDALLSLRTDIPPVMILDLNMPGIDGMEVLRRVKRDHSSIQVIILTGHGSHAEKSLARELGAFAYLNKPTTIDVLVDTINGALQKWSEIATTHQNKDGNRRY